MVVLQHHDGRCCLAINLLADGIRNRLVCYTITIYPGIVQSECSILRRIIQIMLDEPEQLITDLLIVLAISRLRNGDIVQAHHLTRQRRWQEVTILSCLFYRETVSLRHGHRYPGGIYVAPYLAQCSHHAAHTTVRLERMLLTQLLFDGPAMRGNDESIGPYRLSQPSTLPPFIHLPN